MSEPETAAVRRAGTPEDPVLAAGVLLWRTGEAGSPEFLLLRNALHRTWGFPKGHLEPGEDLVAGALREVEEESGVRLAADQLDPDFADTVIYEPKPGVWKRVVHFLLAAPLTATVRPSGEHDELGWFDEAAALERLAHQGSRRALIRAAERLPSSSPR